IPADQEDVNPYRFMQNQPVSAAANLMPKKPAHPGTLLALDLSVNGLVSIHALDRNDIVPMGVKTYNYDFNVNRFNVDSQTGTYTNANEMPDVRLDRHHLDTLFDQYIDAKTADFWVNVRPTAYLVQVQSPNGKISSVRVFKGTTAGILTNRSPPPQCGQGIELMVA